MCMSNGEVETSVEKAKYREAGQRIGGARNGSEVMSEARYWN